MARAEKISFCLFSWLGWSLHRLEITPREEELRTLERGQRPEAGDCLLMRSGSRANSKLSAFPDSGTMALGSGKEGKRLESPWARGGTFRI